MVDPVLRPALPSEASGLSDLALRSKGSWGYDDGFMAACRGELVVRPDHCDGLRTVVADGEAAVLGYYRVDGVAPVGELVDLFVDPPAMGRRVGSLLLKDAVRLARDLGFDVLTIDADPHAEAFYLRAGATRVGSTPSGSVPGRLLPRLELPIARPR